MYRCDTCGELARKLADARRHARQGFPTQREAYLAGHLHTLTRVP